MMANSLPAQNDEGLLEVPAEIWSQLNTIPSNSPSPICVPVIDAALLSLKYTKNPRHQKNAEYPEIKRLFYGCQKIARCSRKDWGMSLLEEHQLILLARIGSFVKAVHNTTTTDATGYLVNFDFRPNIRGIKTEFSIETFSDDRSPGRRAVTWLVEDLLSGKSLFEFEDNVNKPPMDPFAGNARDIRVCDRGDQKGDVTSPISHCNGHLKTLLSRGTLFSAGSSLGYTLPTTDTPNDHQMASYVFCYVDEDDFARRLPAQVLYAIEEPNRTSFLSRALYGKKLYVKGFDKLNLVLGLMLLELSQVPHTPDLREWYILGYRWAREVQCAVGSSMKKGIGIIIMDIGLSWNTEQLQAVVKIASQHPVDTELHTWATNRINSLNYV